MPKKPKPRAHTRKFVNRVWRYALFVRVGGTREEAEAWFKKKFCDGSQVAKDGTDGTVFYLTDERSHLIWFASEAPLAIVAHEALHSAKHVLTHAGLGPLSNETEEAYAYLIQWTVSAVLGHEAARSR